MCALKISESRWRAMGMLGRRAILPEDVQMSDFLPGYVTPPGAGVAGDDPSLKASAPSTAGALSVFEISVEGGPPLHVHDREDESFYVLQGALSVRCGNDTYDAAAGSFVFLPRGRTHRFWSKAGSSKVLLIVVPGGIEDYFREINVAQSEEDLRRVQDKYGIRSMPG